MELLRGGAFKIEFQDWRNGNDDTNNIKPPIDVQNIVENQEYGINDEYEPLTNVKIRYKLLGRLQ